MPTTTLFVALQERGVLQYDYVTKSVKSDIVVGDSARREGEATRDDIEMGLKDSSAAKSVDAGIFQRKHRHQVELNVMPMHRTGQVRTVLNAWASVRLVVASQ
jgi:hypothetical protein